MKKIKWLEVPAGDAPEELKEQLLDEWAREYEEAEARAEQAARKEIYDLIRELEPQIIPDVITDMDSDREGFTRFKVESAAVFHDESILTPGIYYADPSDKDAPIYHAKGLDPRHMDEYPGFGVLHYEERDSERTHVFDAMPEDASELVPQRLKSGEPVTVGLLIMQLVVNLAPLKCPEKGQKLLNMLVMRTVAKPPATTDEARPAQVSPVHSRLNAMPVDHSFTSQVFKGLEELAYTGDSTYALTTSKQSNQKIELGTNPDYCQRYISNKNANWQLALRILTTVTHIGLKAKEEGGVRKGQVPISTGAIIRELTRTAEGENTKLQRNAEFKGTVNDALAVLTTSSIQARDKTGKLAYSGGVLNGTYYERITDKQGNEIRDAWIFELASVEKWATFTEVYTRHEKLLPMPPLRAENVWIPQYLNGKIISMLRSQLYPKRGKGKQQASVSVAWNEIFRLADVKSDGDISARRKQKVVSDVQTQLSAIAENLKADNDKPMYLAAEAPRGGKQGQGAWKNLEVTAYRKPTRKAKIDLGIETDGRGSTLSKKPEN